MKKIFSLLIALSTINHAYAYNPFDVLHQNEPDFVIKEISQEKDSDKIKMNICNVGGSMDQSGNLGIGVKKMSGVGNKITSIIYNLKFNAGDCVFYRVGKVQDLGIFSSGLYSLKGQVKLKYYKSERDINNNYLTSNVSISVGSYYYNNTPNSSLPDLMVKNLDYFDKTTITEYNSQREIYNAIVAEVCNVGSTFVQNGALRVSFRGPNNKDIYAYINSYNSMWYSQECRKVAINANDTGIGNNTSYNVSVRADDNLSVNESDENNNSMMRYLYVPYYYNNYYNDSSYYCNGTRFAKSYNSTGYYCNGTWYYYNNNSNNTNNNHAGMVYCEGNREYLYNPYTYYCGGKRHNINESNNYSNNDTYYCNGSRYKYDYNATSYYCNLTRYSRNGNYNDYNGIDIRLDSITTNNYSKRIYANICNIGSSMSNYYVIKTTFYSSNTGKNITQRNSLKLNNGECSTNEISVNYSDLGIYYNGNLSINAKLEIENYNESNTSNNERTDNIQVSF